MDSYKEIRENLKGIFKDEVRLFSLRGVEKTSMFLGVVATILIVLTFFLLGVGLGSIALARHLNTLLDHDIYGYLLVGGIDLLICVMLVIIVMSRRIPLLTSFFVKLLVNIFNLSEHEDK